MRANHLLYALLVSACSVGHAFAQEFGSADEAKSMLLRAVAEMKADKPSAIDRFKQNTWPFRDRDLHVFCFDGRSGKFTAHEAASDSDVRQLFDRSERHFGADMFDNAREDRITEIKYLSPFPGTTSHVPKRAFVMRVADQVCGVSAYIYNGTGNPNEYIGSSPR